MTILGWDDFVTSAPSRQRAVTIGVFDGVHIGHSRLLQSVLAQKPAMEAVVVTFLANPKRLLHPHSYKGSIYSLEQKLEAFRQAGIDACVLIDFSVNFGTLSGAEFLSLLAKAGTKFICVGPNFRCGHKMDTNAQDIARICPGLDMTASIVDPVLYGGHPVSSSRIRNAILEGRLREAEDMLGHAFKLEIAGGNSLGDGSFRMTIAPDSVLPPAGVYEVTLNLADGEVRRTARIADGAIMFESGPGGTTHSVTVINMVSRE